MCKAAVPFTPTPNAFLDAFVGYFNSKIADSDVSELDKSEVYVVWFCYTLGNAKALISTTREDHMYYEVTYNTNKKELYFDSYVKIRNYEAKII